MSSKTFTTLDTFDTEFSADSVEWCPIEEFANIFVCGTYQLFKNEESGETSTSKKSKRLGRIYLFRVDCGCKLKLLQCLDVAAVLDMKWMHIKLNDKILLGVTNSAGFVQIYNLINNENEPSLVLSAEKSITSEDNKEVLALSLDWSSGKLDTSDTGQNVQIVVSDSKGSISVFTLTEEATLETASTWNAHEFEAWIAAFDYWNHNVIFSGGDDCKLQWFDLRVTTQPAGVSRAHGAGVTSLHSNAAREFLLASGSYDEILRLWDVRSIRCPVSEVNLTGGIWRLKWDPKTHDYLIAACMYGGFKIVDCIKNDMPNVVSQYMEHESIAYGCDWSFLNSSKIQRQEISDQAPSTQVLVATCSFYDHALKLATINLYDDK